MADFQKVRVLMNKNNEEDLQMIFENLKVKIKEKKELSEMDLFYKVGESVVREYNVECCFPSSLEDNCIALSSKTSGDCLYSSSSLVMFGDNTVCNELRVLTSIELFLNAEFYAKHPFLTSFWENNKELFVSFMSVFNCCVSDNAFNSKMFSCSDIVKKEAVYNCHSSNWCSFLCILALSTILERPIETYYPDKKFSKYSLIFNNQKILPRVSVTSLKPISIVFCCLSFH